MQRAQHGRANKPPRTSATFLDHPIVFLMTSIRFNGISTEKGMASASAFAFVPHLKVGELEKQCCESTIRSASLQAPTSY